MDDIESDERGVELGDLDVLDEVDVDRVTRVVVDNIEVIVKYADVVAVLDTVLEEDGDGEIDRDNAGEEVEDGLDDSNALFDEAGDDVLLNNGEILFLAVREPDEVIVFD